MKTLLALPPPPLPPPKDPPPPLPPPSPTAIMPAATTLPAATPAVQTAALLWLPATALPRMIAFWRSPVVARVTLGIGAAATLAGLATIWSARLTIPYSVYVSGLGADGMPTAGEFAFALLSIAAGAGLIASRSIGIRSRYRWLSAWPLAATLIFAGCCFAVASLVTCTAGCPVPLIDPVSTVQDLVHTLIAVAGFVAACFAMLQVAFATHGRIIARVSVGCCLCVAAITITGGLLAIFSVAMDFGAWLEFSGATLALGWLVAFGVSLARIRS